MLLSGIIRCQPVVWNFWEKAMWTDLSVKWPKGISIINVGGGNLTIHLSQTLLLNLFLGGFSHEEI